MATKKKTTTTTKKGTKPREIEKNGKRRIT